MIRLLTKLLEAVLAVLMAVMILDVVWQVFTRYVLRNPSSYTEELATFLLVWIGLMGGAYAYRKRAHLGVDILTMKLQGRAKQSSELLIHACVGIFAVFALFWGGARLVQVMLKYDQVSPALGLKMGHVYLALPLSGVFFLIFAVDFFLAALRGGAEAGAPPPDKYSAQSSIS